jgi:exosortase
VRTLSPKGRFGSRTRHLTRRNVWFVSLILASNVAFAVPLSSLLLSCLEQPAHTHILTIAPLSAALILLQRSRIFATVSYSFGWGLGVTTAAAMLATARLSISTRLTDTDSHSLMMLSLVIWCIGTFILVYGIVAFQAAFFPLLFLGMMVPFPDYLRNAVVYALQSGSTISVYWLFNAASIPVLRTGFLLHVPTRAIEIAPQCSGIRACLFLFVVSVMLAYLFLKRPWTRLLLILSVFPIAAFKNGFRIFTLTVTDMYLYPGALDGGFHHQGGSAFFLISLLGIYLLVRFLSFLETWVCEFERSFSPDHVEVNRTEI